jgi:serine/threonine-protein kinase
MTRRTHIAQEEKVLGGRYKLVRQIASGGMATVWEAEDIAGGGRVAVKILAEALASDEQFVERFRREASAAAGLSHPNVARFLDFGEGEGAPFLVMELIKGETLADKLRREGALDPALAIRIAGAAAAALQAAHDEGIVHRDVKPGNIMVTPEGDIKVLDFGIASAAWAASLTGTGFTIGTATYLSPEQASGEKTTPASDVYALGVVTYEMLTGQPPFTGDSPVAIASAHIHAQVRPVRELAPNVPAGIAQICERALEKDPADRPASAAGFASLLDGQQTELFARPAGTPPTEVLAVARPGHRNWLVPLAVLVVLAVLAALLSSAFGNGKLRPIVQVPHLAGLPRAQAEEQLRQAGLRLEGIEYTQDPAGVVVRSNPPEGDSVEPGTPVTLYVGAEPEPQGEGDEHGDHGKGKGKGGD